METPALARVIRNLVQEETSAPEALELKAAPRARFYEQHLLGDTLDFLQPSALLAYLFRQLIHQLGGAKMGEVGRRTRRSTRRTTINDVERMVEDANQEEDRLVSELLQVAHRRRELRRRYGGAARGRGIRDVVRSVVRNEMTASRRQLRRPWLSAIYRARRPRQQQQQQRPRRRQQQKHQQQHQQQQQQQQQQEKEEEEEEEEEEEAAAEEEVPMVEDATI